MKVVDIERKAVDRLARDLAPKLAEVRWSSRSTRSTTSNAGARQRDKRPAARAARPNNAHSRWVESVCDLRTARFDPKELQEAAGWSQLLSSVLEARALLRPENHL